MISSSMSSLKRFAVAVSAVFILGAAQAPSRHSAAPMRVALAERRNVIPPLPWAQDDPADSLYRAAREALLKNDFRRAATMFRDITERYPKSAYAADALYYRAYALYRNGRESDLREALKSLQEEQVRFPEAATIGDANELVVRIRGALARQGDADAAEAVTTAATTKCAGGSQAGDDIRGEAMNALMQMDAQSAVPIIKAVLQRRDACSVSLRTKAVFLLSQKETSETVSILIETARNDPSADVRNQSVFWLGQVHSDASVAALEQIASQSSDLKLRNQAVFALGQQNSARGAAIIRRLAEGSDTPRQVREQAIFQLGQQHSAANAEFLRILYGKLARSDEGLRKKVLFSLSQMRGVGNEKWLLNMSLDESQTIDVRKHALWTAGQAGISGGELVGLYDKLTDRAMKEQLIWVLSEAREPSASAKLVEIAQKDRDPEMRKKAIFWLGQKNDPRIRQILLDILTKG